MNSRIRLSRSGQQRKMGLSMRCCCILALPLAGVWTLWWMLGG